MKYFMLTVQHKWFVFLAGLRVGASLWRLLLHDWTKFMPSELPHYQHQFFGKADRPGLFIKAWVHHQNAHAHHWEYWIPRTGHNRCAPPYPDNEPIPMPEWAVREMVADWMGASRAYTRVWPSLKSWKWLEQNGDKIRIHPETARITNKVLTEYFGPGNCYRVIPNLRTNQTRRG